MRLFVDATLTVVGSKPLLRRLIPLLTTAAPILRERRRGTEARIGSKLVRYFEKLADREQQRDFPALYPLFRS